jgi:hypothetical protein
MHLQQSDTPTQPSAYSISHTYKSHVKFKFEFKFQIQVQFQIAMDKMVLTTHPSQPQTPFSIHRPLFLSQPPRISGVKQTPKHATHTNPLYINTRIEPYTQPSPARLTSTGNQAHGACVSVAYWG